MKFRRIDVHHHVIPKFYEEAIMEAGAGPTRGAYPEWSPELAIEVMDANDIATAITSVVPGVHFLPPEKARDMARRCNEFSADLAQRWPDRYGAFGSVPMHRVDDAINEIDYALNTLQLDGLCMLSSYGDKYLGDAEYDPVLDKLNSEEAVVFIHPFNSAQQLPGSGQKINLPYPAFMIEYPFDTTRMAAHLILSGAIERFPKIKFILAHAGGTLPFIAWRIYCCQMVSPHFPKLTYEKVLEGVSHFWYDTAMSAGPEMISCLREVAGADKVVFGSDWPLANATATAECTKNLSPEGFLTATQAAAVGRENALKLFPRLDR